MEILSKEPNFGELFLPTVERFRELVSVAHGFNGDDHRTRHKISDRANYKWRS
jgi:hypothetical protein